MLPLSDPPPDVRFERASTFESLEEIVEGVQDYAARVFGDEQAAHCFVLALSEAVTNAIKHGNASDPQKQVAVDIRAKEDCVEAVVTDQGGGFDPSAVENPLEGTNLERSHGRGLHIIEEVADEVHYEAGGRRVRLVFGRKL